MASVMHCADTVVYVVKAFHKQLTSLVTVLWLREVYWNV
jgi:hypothetical protein